LIKGVGAKLWIIGAVDLLLALGSFAVLAQIYQKLARHLEFGWRNVTRKWVKPVLKMAGWSIITTLGGYMLVRTDTWLINRFVGLEMAGVYAAILVWPNFLKQISKQLATVIAPVYLIDYAKGNKDRVARVSFSSAKLLGCFVALCAGALCVGADPLLRLWLGDGAAAHVLLFRIILIYLPYTIGEGVMWQVFVALNKVHFTGVVNVCAGTINILLSGTLIVMGYGAIGVAIATAVAMLLSSSLAIPIGVCRELHVPYRLVLWNYVCATVLMALSAAATYVGLQLTTVSYLGAAAAFLLILASGLLLGYRFMLSDDERLLTNRLAQRILAFVKIRNRIQKNPLDE